MSAPTFHMTPPPHAAHPAPSAPAGPDTGTAGTLLAPRPARIPGRTVAKELVHRHNPAEVMLTGWNRTDEDSFTLSARWPRSHRLFADIDGCHDPLIAAETIRQSGSLLLHAEYEVPFGHHFVMWNLTVTTRPGPLTVRATPADIDLAVTCHDVKRRGKTPVGLHLEAVLHRDGEMIAHGSAAVSCVGPAAYRRLRAPQLDGAGPPLPLTTPVTPHEVGRLSPADVVLSPTPQPGHWLLRVDTHHPVLFEHPVDHVPGMMLLEAARQATISTLGHHAPPTHITGEFNRYAELHRPCHIHAHRLPAQNTQETVLITGEQDNENIFRALVTLPTTHN